MTAAQFMNLNITSDYHFIRLTEDYERELLDSDDLYDEEVDEVYAENDTIFVVVE